MKQNYLSAKIGHSSTPVRPTVPRFEQTNVSNILNCNNSSLIETAFSLEDTSNQEDDDILMGIDTTEPTDGNDLTYNPSQSNLSDSQNTKVSINETASTSTGDYLNGHQPVDIRKLQVPLSKLDDKRTSKKAFCMYCKTLQTKFARHLELKHRNEIEVQEFLCISKGNKRRHELIGKIRQKGNFLHNTNSNFNTGILITNRQATTLDNSPNDYLICKNCLGTFSKKTLRIHTKRCLQVNKNGRGITLTSKKISGYIHERANNVLRRFIFPVLRDDEITRLIKYDELIILFGNKLADKLTDSHHHDQIRSSLRLLGRFKQAIMEMSREITELADVFHPQYYDITVDAVRKCAKYDCTKLYCKAPTVASSLGASLKKCAKSLIAECIKKQNNNRKELVEAFLILFEDDFATRINRRVVEDQVKIKRNKKVVLPLRSDIKKLYEYLRTIGGSAVNVLNNSFDFNSWKNLSEACLISVQMFNRRRAGEIERLTITDYNNQETVDKNVNPELFERLNEKSQEYAKKFTRVTIRGKLGRTVPVLLDQTAVKWIKNMLKFRSEAGISSENAYVFAVPTKNSLNKQYLRACPLMKKFSEECGAAIPSTLRGTILRKHIATYTAMIGIEENQVSDLANFMGHNKQIHKDIYRVPGAVKDVADVSQLLVAAMGADDDYDDEEESNEQNDMEFTNKEIDEYSSTLSVQLAASTSSTAAPKRRSTSPYGKTKRVRWNTEEQAVVISCFGDPKKMIALPSLAQCQEAITKHPVLRNRTPQQIKAWFNNQQRKACS